jgi:hypothetical protein
VLLAGAVLLGLALLPSAAPLSVVLLAQLVALGAGLVIGRLPSVRHHLVSDAVQDATRRAPRVQGVRPSAHRRPHGILISLRAARRGAHDEGIHRALGG